MKLVLLGLMFTDQSLEETMTCSKSSVQMAPHLFQKRMVSGLETNEDTNLIIYSVPPTGSFPLNDKRLFIRKSICGNQIQLGYLNLPWIKHKIQERMIIKVLKKEILSSNEKIYVIAYSLYEPFLKAMDHLKCKYQNLNTCVLHTDPVPGVGDLEKNETPRTIRYGRYLISLIKSTDHFIVLTKQLADAMEIGNRPYMVMECICDETQKLSAVQKNINNICLYSGTTEGEYCIRDLVEAFKLLPNAELWICGSGNCDEYIYKTQKEYPNIKHFGFLSQPELTKLRDACNFLINPRRPTGTYTKYSFPSKTAEYLMSGKPCIMYKLEGIPDEYDKYLNYLTTSKPSAIAMELDALFKSDYEKLCKKGLEARQFMLSEKTSVKQAKRIVDFLQSH